MTARTRFVVVLEGAAGADTAHAHALRDLLKYLLRSHSLHCVDARQLDHRADDAEATPSTGDTFDLREERGRL